jgi:hypothetical protein
MSHAACLIVGIIIGVGLAIWGFASIPRNAARMFNTPPKER